MFKNLRLQIDMAMAVLAVAVLMLMASSWSLYQSYAEADQEIVLSERLRRQREIIKDEVQAIRYDLAMPRADWNVRFVSREEYHDFERRVEAQLQTLEQRVEGLEFLADRPRRASNKVSVNAYE